MAREKEQIGIAGLTKVRGGLRKRVNVNRVGGERAGRKKQEPVTPLYAAPEGAYLVSSAIISDCLGNVKETQIALPDNRRKLRVKIFSRASSEFLLRQGYRPLSWWAVVIGVKPNTLFQRCKRAGLKPSYDGNSCNYLSIADMQDLIGGRKSKITRGLLRTHAELSKIMEVM
jgi:hypothetical protein